MAQVKRSADIEYSVSQMYQLVNDVESYPDFLPWCSKSEILLKTDDIVKAKLYIQKGVINQSFTTENSLTPNERIELRLVDGPFKRLGGYWTFTPLSENISRVELNIAFDFDSPLIAMTLGKLLDNAMNTMVDAFVLRAKTIYG